MALPRIPIPNQRYTVNIAYAVLSFEDRESYLETVYRTERLTIFTENGEVINDVPIDKATLQLIDFPTDYLNETGHAQLGTALVCVNEPIHNKPIIIAVLSRDEESQLLSEGEFKLFKQLDGNSVLVSGNSKEGALFLKVFGGQGKLKIDLSNADNTASMDVSIKGGANIYTEGEMSLKTTVGSKVEILNDDGETESELNFNRSGLSYLDKYENQITVNEDGEIIIKPREKVVLHEGSQPLVLGTELKTQLEKLSNRLDLVYSAIQNGVIVPADGGASFKASMITILGAAQSENFDGINSDKSFTD